MKHRQVSRRDALGTLGLTATAAAVASRELFGQFVNKSTAKDGRIDVHHHHVPPGFGNGGRGARAVRNGVWTPELTLEQMDKFDIAVSILSMTQMGDILYDNKASGAPPSARATTTAPSSCRSIQSDSACLPAFRFRTSTAS